VIFEIISIKYCRKALSGSERGIVPTREMAIRYTIKSSSDQNKTRNKSLEHLVGAILYLELGSNQQAKVLDSKVVAFLIAYYAFEKNNETALRILLLTYDSSMWALFDSLRSWQTSSVIVS
jgi:hypothetical protein